MHQTTLFKYFNPRTRVGCDPHRAKTCSRSDYFNPRTRMGCDSYSSFVFWIISSISIHAPAWGATVRRADGFLYTQISIHAPAWGATKRRSQAPLWFADFNPRTRMGCDRICVLSAILQPQFQSTHPHGVRPQPARINSGRIGISIHAPAWGATDEIAAKMRAYRISIHAPAWGATLQIRGCINTLHDFNPRTRMGCDEGRIKKE